MAEADKPDKCFRVKDKRSGQAKSGRRVPMPAPTCLHSGYSAWATPPRCSCSR